MPTMEKLSSGKHVARRQKVSSDHESRYQVYPRVTVDALSDDVLLEIFDFYLARPDWEHGHEDAWHTLVHVSKRWRCIVFASPHRLQLRLVCTNKRPVQNTLDLWPELPIVIKSRAEISKPQDVDNIIAAVKQHNRVCEIEVSRIPNALLDKIRAMEMENPFSALTFLWLSSRDINPPALPDSFLGGSAPRLQKLFLYSIPFPALPNLFLSTHDLVELRLWNRPPSEYLSPEAMVHCLSLLTRLESFTLGFDSPRSRADRETRLLPRLTRIVLPALTYFSFYGDSEYLGDTVAQIDTPLLKNLQITFFNQLAFDTPLLRHFISRMETFKAPHRADVWFSDGKVIVKIYRRDGVDKSRMLSLAVSCTPSDWQLSSLMQLCNSALSPPLITLDRLEIKNHRQQWDDKADNNQWLEFLQLFTSVKDLVLREKLIQFIAPALSELAGESITEMLPAIQNIFLEGLEPSEPDKKAIGKFAAARERSDPVAVHHRVRGGWQQMHWEVGD